MKPPKYSILFLALIILPNCSNPKSSENSESDISNPEGDAEVLDIPDTLVYSIPLNYSAMIENADDNLKMEISGYKDVLDLFEKLNYTPEAWQAGIREIPRVFFTKIALGKYDHQRNNRASKKAIVFSGYCALDPACKRADHGRQEEAGGYQVGSQRE
jgi:hypothetical protein